MRFETCNEGKEIERCRKKTENSLRVLGENSDPRKSLQMSNCLFASDLTPTAAISICSGLPDTSQGYADNPMM